MYNPKHFRMSEDQIPKWIKQNSFGILVSAVDGQLEATHLPFVLMEENEQRYLITHFSRANPHLRELDQQEVLVIFPGPHSYISATWYQEADTVPTWNYVTVHIRGTCTVYHDQEKKLETLEKMTQFYEQTLPEPWNMERHMDVVHAELPGIVAVRIEISSWEGKEKLNQHHSAERRQRVVNELANYSHYDHDKIAELMKKELEKKEHS